jgi:3-phosphoshikimate 1-carboxyvinyltransferase
MAVLAEGRSIVERPLHAADIAASVRAAEAFGAIVDVRPDRIVIEGRGVGQLQEPPDVVDAANSGTTIRLAAGLAATVRGVSVFTGDASLRRRPMARVLEPLGRLGARYLARGGGFAPFAVRGGALAGGTIELPVASAQVKSALLLAGLAASSPVTVVEPLPSRDHTERLLAQMGAQIRRDGTAVTVEPGLVQPLAFTVPGDPSSAAFWWVAAALTGGEVVTPGVLLNPARVGLLAVLEQAGARVTATVEEEDPEPVGTVTVAGPERLLPVTVEGPAVPALVDELPLVAVLAALGHGTSIVRGARELRVKESDRIAAMAEGLVRLGADIREEPDGWTVTGPARLRGAVVQSRGDHRVAMALAIAATAAEGPTEIQGAQAVAVSYPGFWDVLGATGAARVTSAGR